MNKTALVIIITLMIGVAGGIAISAQTDWFESWFQPNSSSTSKSPHLAFLWEVRNIIQDNYWQKLTEAQLVEIYTLGAEKITGKQLGANIKQFSDLEPELKQVLEQLETEEKQLQFATQLADLVLANLQPQGRSRLYSQQKQQELAERVNNIDPEADHYQTLGLDQSASQQEINQAYQLQKQELRNQTDQASPAAQQKLAQLEQAKQALADQDNRQRYDVKGINPTMDWQLVTPEILHLAIHKFSPTTLEELIEITQKVDAQANSNPGQQQPASQQQPTDQQQSTNHQQPTNQQQSAQTEMDTDTNSAQSPSETNPSQNLDTLILDLRGNVGGAIDGLPYFLGPFIGKNQYAYQFIQQGEITDYKTKTGWLPSLERYKKVVVLVDEDTQSSAEVMASVLKKYNVGVLVGTTTRGWGTIERVFPIDNQPSNNHNLSVFLVHHLTLRADSQPIESNGVEPLVDITQSGWQQELGKYFDDQELIKTVEQLITAEDSTQT